MREIINMWVDQVPQEDLLEAVCLLPGADESAVLHARLCLEGHMQDWLSGRSRPVDFAALAAAWAAAKVWWLEDVVTG